STCNLLLEVVNAFLFVSLMDTTSETYVGSEYTLEIMPVFLLILLIMFFGVVSTIIFLSIKRIKFYSKSLWKQKIMPVVCISGFIGFLLLSVFSFYDFALVIAFPSVISLVITLQTNRDRIIEEIVTRIEKRIGGRRLQIQWNQIYEAAERIITQEEKETELDYREIEDYASQAFQLLEMWQKEEIYAKN
ncbi:MAG: hypothetical protein ACFFBD_25120, partial [Candidatus Hodarchaeota archaeon]